MVEQNGNHFSLWKIKCGQALILASVDDIVLGLESIYLHIKAWEVYPIEVMCILSYGSPYIHLAKATCTDILCELSITVCLFVVVLCPSNI